MVHDHLRIFFFFKIGIPFQLASQHKTQNSKHQSFIQINIAQEPSDVSSSKHSLQGKGGPILSGFWA